MANSLEILITGKDQFSPKAQKAQRSAKGLKGGMASLGKTVLGVGAGFIAAQASIAGVSKLFTSTIGAAIKFEAQLAQIRALTGATKKDTDFLSGALKDLSKEIGKSPEELGAGAYFILSSGIEDAADAVEVLEIAAKASTIGLGETATVADALTTVLNAYGLEASAAAHVTDVMIEAVKQGKAEASAFAGVLGRVVPLAAEMGINFEQVAANLATFTRLGVSAEEAATGLRSVMVSLKKPTTEAEEVLAAIGTSAQEVRQQIREKGLLSVLADLMTKFKGNEEALVGVFGNIRALTSVLGTAGGQLEDYKDILAATETATGNLEEGFGIVSDTAQQKMKVAMAELNIVMLELGENVLPIVVPIARAFALVVADIAAAAAIATNPLEALKVGIEGLNKPMLGLLTPTEVTRETIVGLGRDAKMSNDEIADWGKQIGLTGEEISEAFREADGAAKQFIPTAVDVTDQLGDIANAAPVTTAALEDMGKSGVSALEDIMGAAEAAGSAIDDMMQVTTVESANAEAALSDLKLEAFDLENKVGDLTAAEAARLAQINDDLIPAQDKVLERIGLEIDASGALALSKDGTLVSVRTLIGGIEDEGTALSDVGDEYHDLLVNKILPAEAEWLEEHRILTTLLTPALDDYKNMMASIPDVVRTSLIIDLPQDIAAALLVAGATPRQHGGPVSAGQAVLVGERRPEIFVPDRAGTILPNVGMAGGGTTIQINFSGPILGDERTAMEFANLIAPEIRRMMN